MHYPVPVQTSLVSYHYRIPLLLLQCLLDLLFYRYKNITSIVQTMEFNTNTNGINLNNLINMKKKNCKRER